ncbi:MAG: O-antigen ligase family protein [Actinomycetota bacterium]|nr:O-antigen ligase family protein [Actinomycetota bacterium]
MPDELRLPLAFALALGAAYAVTPRAIAVAVRADFHDHPGGYKGVRGPTPYLGGAAVVIGFLLAAPTLGGEFARLSPILGCAFGLWVLGTVDDRRHLSPGFRLAVEGVAAIFLWATGLGWGLFASDAANLAITIVWTLALVNAFNLMDNMDGAAATIAAVTGVSVGVLALLEGDPALAALSLGLAGACLGFLPYNLARPSRIFLGDGGSIPIGFVMAATIMALPEEVGGGLPRLLSAGLLSGLLALDPCLVVVSRLRAGVPLMAGARDHLTHRLLTRLRSPRAVAVALGGTQAILGSVAIGVTELGSGSVLAAWTIWFVAAAAGVALLETRNWLPVREAAVLAEGTVSVSDTVPAPDARGSAVSAASPQGGPDSGPSPVEIGMIAFVGLSCGVSPFFFGFYGLGAWGPIGLGLLAALLGLLIARPVALRPPAFVALGGLVGLWLWAALSTGWSESADQALTGANRWLLYSALFAVLIVLVRNDRLARVVLGAGTAAVLVLAGYVMFRLAAGEGSSLFFEGRLNEPLGYTNGVAGYLMLGFWPLVAVAERHRGLLQSGLAVSGAVMVAGLVVLTQTRSIVLGVLISGAVVVAVVPGRSRRLWLLLGLGAALVACLGPLLEVFDSTDAGGLPAPGTARSAALALTITAVVSGAAWAAVRVLAARVEPQLESGGVARRVVALTPFVLVAVIAVGGIAVVGDPVERVKDQYRAFVDLEGEGELSSRFTSGSGNRYDYWRVAVNQFSDDPLKGVGAGNYDRTYFLERRTDEDVRQPHSLLFQSLAELGLVGTLLLAIFVLAVLTGLARRALAARADPAQVGIVVAAGGAFTAWLVQTAFDWVHLVPGITGLALCAAACLVGPWQRPVGHATRRTRVGVAVVCGVLVLLGAVMLGRATLADHYRSRGEDALSSDPRRALSDADRSLDLNGEALPALYLQAAAYARLDDYARARATLLKASRLEPHDHVPWVLLGDLATRRGDVSLARRLYSRAAALNPRDISLSELAEGSGS